MRPAIAGAFKLGVIAKCERAVAERISTTVRIKLNQALVHRFDFDAAQRFQVDTLDHDDTHILGSSTLVPSIGLRSLGRLDLLWCPPPGSFMASGALAKFEPVYFPEDCTAGFPHQCPDLGA